MSLHKFKIFCIGFGSGVLATLGAVWFWKSKIGKRTREGLKETWEDFYDYMMPKIRKYKKMGYDKLQEFTAGAVEEYAKMRNLPEEKKEELREKARDFWNRLEE